MRIFNPRRISDPGIGESMLYKGRKLSQKESECASKPGTWPVAVVRSNRIAIASLELDPPEAYDGGFNKASAAESAAESATATLAWKNVPFNQVLDFTQVFGPKDGCVVHARLILEADRDCALRLSMGSDDGLCVIVNGTRRFVNNTSRGVRLGDDQAEVPLAKGRNTLLFRVNQGGGGYGLAVEVKATADAKIVQVAP